MVFHGNAYIMLHKILKFCSWQPLQWKTADYFRAVNNENLFQSINVVSSSTLNVADKPNKERKYTVDRHKAAPEETEQLINPSGDGHVGQVQAENVTTLSSSATLSSVKSVRNYKRTRPASTLQGWDDIGGFGIILVVEFHNVSIFMVNKSPIWRC